jgi:hypothetical protein
MYGAQPGAKELLLELMLLDAGVPLPRDTYALRASYGAPVTGGTQLGGGTGEQRQPNITIGDLRCILNMLCVQQLACIQHKRRASCTTLLADPQP